MTNDEIPNDERMTKHECRMSKAANLRAGEGNPVRRRGIQEFVIRISGFFRHWVFRHSSFLSVGEQ